MRGLIFHCERFSYELVSGTPAAWPDTPGRTGGGDDVLVVFVAIEQGDGETLIAPFAKEIRRWWRRAGGAGGVVLNPYCHLTAAPAQPDRAGELCRKLHERLAGTLAAPVALTSFGWTKAFMCDVAGDRSAQGWIEIVSKDCLEAA